jgi:predicted histone-like DNA-binding protein
MPVLYNKIERANPRKKEEKKWYPVLKSTGLVKEREVAKQLADETTLNPREAEMAVGQLMKVVTKLLLNGNTVQLGELGSFRLTAKTEASNKKEEVTAQKIKKVRVRFSESTDLKNAIAKASFKEVESLIKK